MALFLLGLVACGEDFDPKSLVNKPRILAIQADNPRLAVGELSTLRALAVDAEGADDFSFFWEACLFTGSPEDGYPCENGELPGELTSLLQGEGPEFLLIYLEPVQQLVDQFCSFDPSSIDNLPDGISLPSCGQGMPIRVRLTATHVPTGEEIVAVKTIYLKPTPEILEVQDNANPGILSLAATLDGSAVVGEEHEVRCSIDDATVESFVRLGQTDSREEELLISWFVRNGSLDSDLTFWSSETDKDEAQLNTVKPKEPGTSTVWCVIRDGRGGVDWRELDIDVGPAP